jgi:hypothetical protein
MNERLRSSVCADLRGYSSYTLYFPAVEIIFLASTTPGVFAEKRYGFVEHTEMNSICL